MIINHANLIDQLQQLETEQINPNTVDIDTLTPLEITKKISAEDKTVAEVVSTQLEQIADTATLFASTIRSGGRIFYVGAGTSGRLGVLDAAECPPTFGTDPKQIKGIISGGYETLIMSQEGVEDNRQAAIDDLKAENLSSDDLVIGIAASVRTPYTRTALSYAKEIGAKTAFIICNRAKHLSEPPDIIIELPVGPEVITGSTRMKSGTAQKMTLNMISTTAMVLLGKTYGNLMVDLQARSEKLSARSRKILIDLLNIELKEADKLLAQAKGSVKTAIVMSLRKCNYSEAVRLIDKYNGFLVKVISDEGDHEKNK